MSAVRYPAARVLQICLEALETRAWIQADILRCHEDRGCTAQTAQGQGQVDAHAMHSPTQNVKLYHTALDAVEYWP